MRLPDRSQWERWAKLIARGAIDVSRISQLKEMCQQRNRPNAVFIWIPKTAGTSLATALSASKFLSANQARRRFAQRGIVTFGHMSYRQLLEIGIVKDHFDQSAFKFAFVRHPYDRTLSLYYQLKQHGLISRGSSFEGFLQHLIDDGFTEIGLYNVRALSQCNPQHTWVDDVDVDFIGHYESLYEDSQYIFSRLGILDNSLLRLNKTKERDDNLLSASARERIQYLYAEDFEQFGYGAD